MSSAALVASVAAESTSARYAAGAGLLVLAQDATLRVWSLTSLGDAGTAVHRGSTAEEPGVEPDAELLLLESPPGCSVLAVGERRDGTRLIAAASTETLLLHPIARGEPLQPCESRSLALDSFGRAELRAAHFDGAARRLALCAGTEVWLVDADACRPLLILQGHAAPTSLCCFASASAVLGGVYASAAARARAEEQDLICCVAEDRGFHLWRLPPVGAVGAFAADAALLLREALPPSGAAVLSGALHGGGEQLALGDAAGKLHVYEPY